MTSSPAAAPTSPESSRWSACSRWLTGRRGDVLIGVSLFVMLVVARTWGVSRTMWLLGDQIRDWSAALGAFSSLPLTGPPSVAGGTSLGPIYYWLLWLIRVTIGPWFDNLPHAGAYGLALLHAGADVVLFFALRRLTQSAVMALSVVLLLATAPYDLALSSTVWSPPLAVSFVKVALALFIVNAHDPSRWRMAATLAVGWLAVQTHSSTILVFLPLATWFVVRELWARRWRSTLETVRLIVEIVLVLQIPYIVDRIVSDAPRGAPTMIAEGVGRLLADPASARPAMSLEAVVGIFRFLWGSPFEVAWLPWLLTAAAAGTLAVARRRPELVFASVVPLAAAVIGFSAWTRPIEAYWFLGLAPAVAVMFVAGMCGVPARRAREAVALVFLLVVAYAVPPRLAVTRNIHRLPEYETLVQGSRAIARRTLEVGAIASSFELPTSTDPTFLFVCLGGRLSTSAPYDAIIGADGTVTFRERR